MIQTSDSEQPLCLLRQSVGNRLRSDNSKQVIESPSRALVATYLSFLGKPSAAAARQQAKIHS
jgi:hypothetical protein